MYGEKAMQESPWASREEASANQLRRFSSHTSCDGTPAAPAPIAASAGAFHGSLREGCTASTSPFASSLPSPHCGAAVGRPTGLTTSSTITMMAAAIPAAPTLRTLSAGFASLEHKVLSALPAPSRLASAPVARRLSNGTAAAVAASATPSGRLQPLQEPVTISQASPPSTPGRAAAAAATPATSASASPLRGEPQGRSTAAAPGRRPQRSGHLAPVREALTAAALASAPLAAAPSAPPVSPKREEGAPDVAAGARAAAVAVAKARGGRIKVVVRKRPFNPGEGGADCVEVRRPQLVLSVTKQRIDLSEYTESSEYSFDDVFTESVSNESVYQSCGEELLDVALQGGSASMFAYGQTGSGKTFTMMGDPGESDGGEKGMYLLGAADFFKRMLPSQTLRVAFYEIYCNSLFDLLNDRFPVVLREDGNRRVNVCNLTWHPITSTEELWAIVRSGLELRRTGSTSANERSSRSHAIMSIRVKDAADGEFEGTLNFVDLAGSERGADTANNDRLTRLEGAEINKSLLALKECIRALGERKRHVPFRGSRLTEVLRDSFTGNSKTVMIANVSPSSLNYEHTANTLRYAFRVQGLSIASVVPSKARNAPRPFVLNASPAGRQRQRPPVSPPEWRRQSGVGPTGGGCDQPAAEGVGQEESCGGGQDGGSPQRRRHRSQRGDRQPRTRSSRGGSVSPSPFPRLTSAAEVGGGEEEEGHGRNGSRSRNPLAAPHPSPELKRRKVRGRETSGVSVLLPADEPSPLHKVGRGPANYAAGLADGMEDSPHASPSYAHAHGNTNSRAEYADMDSELLRAIESRVKAKVMQQLQRDLGREIQQILDERDGVIASLRAENARLRGAVRRYEAQQGASDCGPAPAVNGNEPEENRESDDGRDSHP